MVGRGLIDGRRHLCGTCALAVRAGAMLALAAGWSASAPAAGTPAPNEPVIQARFAYRYDPATHCADVRAAQPDDAPVAVIVFRVGTTGVPSQAAVRSSSGSATLDSAALACVMKLRFRPATSMGEGAPVESWQQAAWKSPPHALVAPAAAPAPAPAAAPAPAPAAATVAAPPAAVAAATATGGVAASVPRAPAAAPPGAVVVHLCVDASGRLTAPPRVVQSSGDAQSDAAALQVATAASGRYRAGAGGCQQLTLAPDAR